MTNILEQTQFFLGKKNINNPKKLQLLSLSGNNIDTEILIYFSKNNTFSSPDFIPFQSSSKFEVVIARKNQKIKFETKESNGTYNLFLNNKQVFIFNKLTTELILDSNFNCILNDASVYEPYSEEQCIQFNETYYPSIFKTEKDVKEIEEVEEHQEEVLKETLIEEHQVEEHQEEVLKETLIEEHQQEVLKETLIEEHHEEVKEVEVHNQKEELKETLIEEHHEEELKETIIEEHNEEELKETLIEEHHEEELKETLIEEHQKEELKETLIEEHQEEEHQKEELKETLVEEHQEKEHKEEEVKETLIEEHKEDEVKETLIEEHHEEDKVEDKVEYKEIIMDKKELKQMKFSESGMVSEEIPQKLDSVGTSYRTEVSQNEKKEKKQLKWKDKMSMDENKVKEVAETLQKIENEKRDLEKIKNQKKEEKELKESKEMIQIIEDFNKFQNQKPELKNEEEQKRIENKFYESQQKKNIIYAIEFHHMNKIFKIPCIRIQESILLNFHNIYSNPINPSNIILKNNIAIEVPEISKYYLIHYLNTKYLLYKMNNNVLIITNIQNKTTKMIKNKDHFKLNNFDYLLTNNASLIVPMENKKYFDNNYGTTFNALMPRFY